MMRKAISNGGLPGKEGSGRRYWMHANPVAAKPATEEPTGKRPPKARFLEPYRLSEGRREALIQLLSSRGVGDREGRELFASAIEYDIATVRQTLAREAPAEPPEPIDSVPESIPEARDRTLALPADLGYTARSLAERVTGLDGPLRDAVLSAMQDGDPFHRVYASAYLDALCVELLRLAEAVANGPQPASPGPIEPPSPPVPEPDLSGGARRFLRRVARVYEEVLESKADLFGDGAFLEVLTLVAEEAGILLPQDPARRAEALQAP